jgi:hypothetical protein
MQVPGRYLFRDSMKSATAGTHMESRTPNEGAWVSLPLLPGQLTASIFNGVEVFSAPARSKNRYIELLPDYGFSFNHSKLAIDSRIMVLDSDQKILGDMYAGHSASVNLFCLPGNPYSGLSVVIKHPKHAIGHKLEIISHDILCRPTVEYASGDTAVSRGANLSNAITLVFERLPGNTIEVKVSIDGSRFITRQCTVGAQLLKQSAIILGLNNNNINDTHAIAFYRMLVAT